VAAAMSVVMFALIITITLLLLRTMRTEETRYT